MIDEPLPPKFELQGKLYAIFPIVKFIAFPKTIVPLHIFEKRYQQMLKDITEGIDGENALVLTNLDHISGLPYNIGVLGKIISQETLSDGRSNILVECIERVKVKDYFRPYSNDQYAIGEVEPYIEESIVNYQKEWENIYPNLLKLFKQHFRGSTGKEFAIYSERRLNQLNAEEIINAMCQFSNLGINVKIQLLQANSLMTRANILQNKLNETLIVK